MSPGQRDEAAMLRSPRVEEVTDSEEETTTRMTSAPEEKPVLEESGLSDEEDYPGITFVDLLRFVMLAMITSSGLSYLVTQQSFTWGYKPWNKLQALKYYINGPINLTPSQLALYNGSDPSLPIYLAVNGSIFDVSSGERFYGKGASYNHLAGAEANRAYVTGCFAEDRTPDLRGVEQMFMPIEDCEQVPSKEGCEGEAEMSAAEKKVRREQETRRAKKYVVKAVEGWFKFYDKSDKYVKIGRVIPEPDGAELKEEQPVPTLCAAAESQRPKRSEMKKYEQERLSREAMMAKVTGRPPHHRRHHHHQ